MCVYMYIHIQGEFKLYFSDKWKQIFAKFPGDSGRGIPGSTPYIDH